jgi:hypothetical protein
MLTGAPSHAEYWLESNQFCDRSNAPGMGSVGATVM